MQKVAQHETFYFAFAYFSVFIVFLVFHFFYVLLPISWHRQSCMLLTVENEDP